MKQLKFLFAFYLIISTMACVQQTHKKVVVFTVTVSNSVDSIKTVGVRGQHLPLNWKEDVALEPVGNNTFKSVVVYNTGFAQTEVKFVVNNEFEFKNEDNRLVNLSTTDTTFVTAVYNKR